MEGIAEKIEGIEGRLLSKIQKMSESLNSDKVKLS
jgi:hypothetical protein